MSCYLICSIMISQTFETTTAQNFRLLRMLKLKSTQIIGSTWSNYVPGPVSKWTRARQWSVSFESCEKTLDMSCWRNIVIVHHYLHLHPNMDPKKTFLHTHNETLLRAVLMAFSGFSRRVKICLSKQWIYFAKLILMFLNCAYFSPRNSLNESTFWSEASLANIAGESRIEYELKGLIFQEG